MRGLQAEHPKDVNVLHHRHRGGSLEGKRKTSSPKLHFPDKPTDSDSNKQWQHWDSGPGVIPSKLMFCSEASTAQIREGSTRRLAAQPSSQQ